MSCGLFENGTAMAFRPFSPKADGVRKVVPSSNMRSSAFTFLHVLFLFSPKREAENVKALFAF